MAFFYEYGEDIETIFELWVQPEEKEDIAYQWSDRPIEIGSTLKDHGVKQPTAYSVSGTLSAHRPGEDEDRDTPIEALRSLEAAADNKTIFTVVGQWIVVSKATVTGIQKTLRKDGDAVDVTITFQPYTETDPETVDIPRSRLRNPRKGKGKTKGKGEKKDATEELPNLFGSGDDSSEEKSWATRLSGLAGG